MKKTIIIFLLIPMFFGFRTGQEIDEKKMNRDLEIAKNILATLIKSGSDSFFGGGSIDASYIRDYGVVFTIPEHLVYFSTGGNYAITIPEVAPVPEIAPMPEVDIQYNIDIDSDEDVIVHEKEAREKMKQAEKEMQQRKKEMDKVRVEVEKRNMEMRQMQEERRAALAEARELKQFYVGSENSSDINWEEVMITFMTDYADLIGQLQPNEKIVINQKSPLQEMVFVWRNKDGGSEEKVENTQSSISAEVMRKDITAYKSDKINKEEFIKRISISKIEPQKKIADLEMFSSIFDRFYSYDLSETFYSKGKPNYEVLDGFGVVFHISAVSPNQSYNRVRFYGPGESTGVNSQKDKKVDDEIIYPKFKEDIKNFMLDYGRTIRSLKDSDKVFLEINIQGCKDCEIPKTLEVSAKLSTLKQYDQQKLSKDKALGSLEIKETF